MGNMTLAVLVAFYLFLAVRWDLVHRILPYLVGSGAVVLVMLATLFGLGRDGRTVMIVFVVLGTIVAFAAGIATCCKMKLPIDSKEPDDEEVEIL
jgi:hypothetical protein